MNRMKSTGLRAAACAAIAASILGCAEKKEKVREERVPVTVAVAEQRDIPVQVKAIGSVQPISNVAVRALVAGQLQRVWFREGDQKSFDVKPSTYYKEGDSFEITYTNMHQLKLTVTPQ